MTHRTIELLVATIRAGRVPEPAEFAGNESSARNRAEERLPLADILSAYHVAVQYLWQIITELAHATGDERDLVEIGVQVHRFLRTVTMAVLRGYRADQAPLPPIDHDRRQLFLALASGSEPERVAQRLGLTLAPRYWVVAIEVAPDPQPASAAIGAVVAARRTARRLERELDRIGRGETLRQGTESGGAALLPFEQPPVGAQPARMQDRFAELRERLSTVERAVGAPVLFAVDLATPPDVPVALGEVHDLLRVARYARRESGVVRFQDLAVEYQLSRPSRVTAIQRELLRPIASDPVLCGTLEAYLWHQCNAGAAAAALHVHPNTVSYRLRKTAELLGLDFTKPRDLMRAFAAVIATRYTSEQPNRQRDVHLD
ncbi:helix-turn-helix domain-containing protein [Nocardia sp. JMUB6875]|uniref:PucR family transcriptional regulator n=1 Tax=Nocardia sp. JMUB6875 TaxID=3158170 RepID=UPI0032E74BAB